LRPPYRGDGRPQGTGAARIPLQVALEEHDLLAHLHVRVGGHDAEDAQGERDRQLARDSHRAPPLPWHASDLGSCMTQRPRLARIVPRERSRSLGVSSACGRRCCASRLRVGQMNRGAMTSVIVLSSLISTWRLGPAVSLNGSPTVSPTTAALWASEAL